MAAADEPTGCDAFKWPLDHERAALASPGKPAVANGALTADAAATLELAPFAEAGLPHAPERAPKSPQSNAGHFGAGARSKRAGRDSDRSPERAGSRHSSCDFKLKSRIIPFIYWEKPVEPIVGILSVRDAADSVAPVAPHEAYLTIAVGLMRGAKVLAGAPLSESAMAHALLSGHILECSLKAFLSKAGLTEREVKKKDVRHNLLELWARAASKGLSITAIPPDWAQTLNRLHNSPHKLRYPMGLHGLVSPNIQQATSELEHLIDSVRQTIG